MLDAFIIKTWSEVEVGNKMIWKWTPSWYYPIRQPCLSRTVGYMRQVDVDKLKTKNDVLRILKKQGKISCL